MAFTTWTAYHTEILNALQESIATGSFVLQAYTDPNGMSRTFRNHLELERHVDWVASKIVAENAATDGRGRPLFLGGVQ